MPDAYALDNLEPVRVRVAEGESKKVSLTLLAIRALTGSVQVYDLAKGAYVPLDGVSVRLTELDRGMTTDREGRYLFRDLPSGTFTISVDGQNCGQVQISAAPQLLRHDIRLKSFTSAKMSDTKTSPR